MKKQRENERFLMPQKHVWRYTLRLFHIFGLLEKKGKIDANMDLLGIILGLPAASWGSFWASRRLLGALGRALGAEVVF